MLRIVLVAVLALIVPLQGVAAVVAGQCMVMGHHQDAGAPDHAHADGDAHDHAASHHDGNDEGKSSHCGPCAACCASASIAGSAGLPIPAAPAAPKHVLSPLPPRVVQPHGFDRPPLAL